MSYKDNVARPRVTRPGIVMQDSMTSPGVASGVAFRYLSRAAHIITLARAQIVTIRTKVFNTRTWQVLPISAR